MKSLVRIALLLVIVLVSLSAYLRLAHSGIGCPDWPGCYGLIGEPVTSSQTVVAEDAYQNLVEQANEPLAWATPLHRLVASVLGLLVVFISLLAFRIKRSRVISLVLLALTLFLAVLGIRSGSLHNPAVVMGNLAGGFCMLGLLGWMVFHPDISQGVTPGGDQCKKLPALVALLAVVSLCIQIILGGLTSANFAATACPALPDCNGAWIPGPALATAFDLSRQHRVTSQGVAVGGEERIAIHQAHRLGALLTLAAAMGAGLMALFAGGRYRKTAGAIMLLVMLEFGVGITAILTRLPIGLAVAHNWLAALLLLCLLSLLAEYRRDVATNVK